MVLEFEDRGSKCIGGSVGCGNTLPVQKKSFNFNLNEQIVVFWSDGCFSWSGLGTASQQNSWMYWMAWHVFSSLAVRAYSTMQQDNNAKIQGSSCERIEHEDTWVSGSMRSHFHTWFGPHRVLTLTPLKVFGVRLSFGQKWMQLWVSKQRHGKCAP